MSHNEFGYTQHLQHMFYIRLHILEPQKPFLANVTEQGREKSLIISIRMCKSVLQVLRVDR